MAAVAGAGFATAATAAGAGAGVNANVDAAAQVVARDNPQAGGSADARMGPAGSTNSNAQWQSGAAQGADRAAGRMNPKGTEMKQSSDTEPEATGFSLCGIAELPTLPSTNSVTSSTAG